jgi:hypothetical protein
MTRDMCLVSLVRLRLLSSLFERKTSVSAILFYAKAVEDALVALSLIIDRQWLIQGNPHIILSFSHDSFFFRNIPLNT